MLPGMIATIVLLLGTLEWQRRGFLGPDKQIEFPTSVLTALGWTPAGRIEKSDGWMGQVALGFASNYVRTTGDFIQSLREAERARYPTTPEEFLRDGVSIDGCGLPVPWLMQTQANAMYVIPSGNNYGFGYSCHRFVLGLIPVVEEGNITTRPTPRVSPFVYNYLTYYPDPLGFLLNTVIFSTLWMPITAWHRRRRAKRGGCTRCGYSREGLAESAVCPECGLGAWSATTR
jgi:hypothetical protein